MTSLMPGSETNIGLIFRLLQENGKISLYYEPGIQWRGWQRAHEVVAGVGINRQMRRAYTYLARHYAPGDQIYLIGYSRGAYAVRALAGMIDRLGLARRELLTPELVTTLYTHYRDSPDSAVARSLVARVCHPKVRIKAVGVFDTVSALGNRWPLLWWFAPKVHVFHSKRLGQSVERGFHALALHERRMAFAPELWEVEEARLETIEQVWFRGVHGLVGGQLEDESHRRPMSNIPLVWMLSRLEEAGLTLPQGWCQRFPQDPEVAKPGTLRSWGHLFAQRRDRVVGRCKSEKLHVSVGETAPKTARHLPIVGEMGCKEIA